MAIIPDMNVTELNARHRKKVYMITYSQENKGLSVRGLIKMVEVTTISICISAKKNKRFGVKRKLGIIANFTERHCNYITAF